MSKKHPGYIKFFEINDGKEKLVKNEPIENIPETMRFITIDGKDYPVVKCVHQKSGNFTEIIEYGPKNKFLRSTIA